MTKKIGGRTLKLSSPVSIIASASVAGKKEGEGPLKHCYDYISDDSYFGEQTWEKSESHMLKQCFELCCSKAKMSPNQLDFVFSGDLLNQCVSSAFAMKDSGLPYFGLYGACSTMIEALALAAMAVDGGFAEKACAATGSHFCSAERQYRFPLEYGGQRTPTSQWTVTGAGAAIVSSSGAGPLITHITPGIIVDAGIKDANNMGAAMAPAAFETIKAHFQDTNRDFSYYDAVFTGDLGAIGHDLLEKLLQDEGISADPKYMDCGVLIYDLEAQDVHAGGSGCGCCASVLCGHILRGFAKGTWNRVLVAATGALMSPLTCQQGGSIPGICHAISIERQWC